MKKRGLLRFAECHLENERKLEINEIRYSIQKNTYIYYALEISIHENNSSIFYLYL